MVDLWKSKDENNLVMFARLLKGFEHASCEVLSTFSEVRKSKTIFTPGVKKLYAFRLRSAEVKVKNENLTKAELFTSLDDKHHRLSCLKFRVHLFYLKFLMVS